MATRVRARQIGIATAGELAKNAAQITSSAAKKKNATDLAGRCVETSAPNSSRSFGGNAAGGSLGMSDGTRYGARTRSA